MRNEDGAFHLSFRILDLLYEDEMNVIAAILSCKSVLPTESIKKNGMGILKCAHNRGKPAAFMDGDAMIF